MEKILSVLMKHAASTSGIEDFCLPTYFSTKDFYPDD
jgi:hypothetical protein